MSAFVSHPGPFLLDQPNLRGLTPVAAYCPSQRLKGAHTGALGRLYNVNLGTQQDAGQLPNGELDVATGQSFLGASNGSWYTLYDHTGNGHHVSQAAAGYRPLAATAGVIAKGPDTTRRVSFTAAAASYYMALDSAAFSPQIASPFTVMTITRMTTALWLTYVDLGNASYRECSCGYYNASFQNWASTGTTNLMYNGLDPRNVWVMQFVVFNGASSVLRVNGVETAGALGAGAAIVAVRLGVAWSNTSSFLGDMLECVIWANALTTSQMLTIEAHRKAYYWGSATYPF